MLQFPFNQAVAGLVFFSLSFSNAWGASFSVDPVIAHITEKQRITSFNVKNQSATATAIELQVFRWEQINGEEKLSPAPEMLVTPTIFKLPGSASQIIRVGMRQPVLHEKEQAYRLFLKEIPAPPEPGFQGLNVLLKISLPIFTSKTMVSPALQWRAIAGKNGKLKLDINNAGLGHTKILQINLRNDTQEPSLNIKRQTYLLAGDHQQWSTELDVKPGTQLKLEADTSKGQVNTILKVE